VERAIHRLSHLVLHDQVEHRGVDLQLGKVEILSVVRDMKGRETRSRSAWRVSDVCSR